MPSDEAIAQANAPPARSAHCGRPSILALLLLILVVALWHFPLTLGGKMPAGGDVIGFFLPLMHSYQNALRTGVSLLWNHHWGYGFPQAAESQTGAYYPLRWILYRFLPLESAFVVELLLHVALAGTGALVFARQLGLSHAASLAAGLTFCGSGFFISHLAHQWAYSGAAWLPWILTAALPGADTRERGCATISWRRCVAVALLVAAQLLTGHYQVAFFTAVALFLLVAVELLAGAPRAWAIPVCLGWILGIGLASVQWLQTVGLLLVGEPPGHGLEYAGEFGLSPVHLLINLVLPTAFHVVPAWRPIAWDPFHSSPEESLAYFGFVPLVLSPFGVMHGSQRLRRTAVTLLVVGLLCALLPFVPVLRRLLDLPVLESFRAPSRWLLVAALGTAITTGAGLDALTSGRVTRWQRKVAVALLIVTCWIAAASAVVATLSGAFGSVLERESRTAVYRVAALLGPWELPPNEPSLEGSPYPSAPLLRLVQVGVLDPAVAEGAQRAVEPATVFRVELLGPWLTWVFASGALWACSFFPRCLPACVVGTLAVELALAQQLTPVSFVERSDIATASTVLNRLRPGVLEAVPFRVVGLPGNVALLSGAASLPGYRTVDLPVRVPAPLSLWATFDDPAVARAHRLAGVRAYVAPLPRKSVQEALALVQARFSRVEVLDDPYLHRLLYGRGTSRVSTDLFLLCESTGKTSTAWFFSEPVRADSPGWFLRSPSKPVRTAYQQGGLVVEMTVQTSSGGLVLWTVPHWPAWKATGTRQDGERVPLKRVQSPEGWTVIEVPTAGRWTIVLTYRDPYYEAGKTITLLTLVSCVGASVVIWQRRPRAPQRLLHS